MGDKRPTAKAYEEKMRDETLQKNAKAVYEYDHDVVKAIRYVMDMTGWSLRYAKDLVFYWRRSW